jgi:hypothetical protein
MTHDLRPYKQAGIAALSLAGECRSDEKISVENFHTTPWRRRRNTVS